jgi:hypothetical protein
VTTRKLTHESNLRAQRPRLKITQKEKSQATANKTGELKFFTEASEEVENSVV